MSTAFIEGQIVRAYVAAQGLTAGASYRVIRVETASGQFGCTTYTLSALASPTTVIHVTNGHLLLAPASLTLRAVQAELRASEATAAYDTDLEAIRGTGLAMAAEGLK